MGVDLRDNGQDGNKVGAPRKNVGWLDTTTKIATPILGALSFIPGLGKFADIGSKVLNGVNNAINGDDVPNQEVGNKINQQAQQQAKEAADTKQQLRDSAAGNTATAAPSPGANM